MLRKNRIRLTVALLLGFIGLVTGVFFAQHLTPKTKDLSQFQGTLLQNTREVVDFKFKDTRGGVFNNAALHGQWTMLFFGFTRCGYLCPTSMSELNKMYTLLEERGISPLPQIVFVTVDPDRDDLDTLKKYTTAFNPHFYGARAEETALKPLATDLGIAYEQVAIKQSTDDNYDIQHSGAVMLFNPNGKLCAFFTVPHNAAALAADYQLLIS